jgi:hypothetical protein
MTTLYAWWALALVVVAGLVTIRWLADAKWWLSETTVSGRDPEKQERRHQPARHRIGSPPGRVLYTTKLTDAHNKVDL